MRTIYFTSILLIMTVSIEAWSQSFLSVSDKEIVNEEGQAVLLRGMGLGGWMLQEGYMLQTASFANAQHKIERAISDLIGEEAKQEFYEAWLDNHVTKADIDSLASWGFNSVRLPMHYNLYTLPIENEPIRGEQTWLDRGFELTDNLIEWCRANGMYVILDLHAAPGGQGRDEGISDYDTTKPSLWESELNKEKTIALWRRLAERYADEPVVAGYDLINETNWDLPNNNALKDLYLRLTDAIREVDQRHIIFIEGNWFANDFTNLTPPWDDQIVYSPHKYWSFNNKEVIQWVLNIREEHNVPLYFGEAGENSNEWFTDAIRLFEDNNIGWAWWPMKKVESISGPLSVRKTTGYQGLLDYWEGRTSKPTPELATRTLMQLTEDLKIENCRYQKDVVHAMFNQVQSGEAVPYRTFDIPGVVHATDYDMGINGEAYQDNQVADFRVSSGNFTAWNNGWSYRNDGVDIEKSEDNVNSNGYNVGWLDADEWMQYSINVEQTGFYNVRVRIASNGGNGAFHFASGNASISDVIRVPNTNGWQTWTTVIVPNVLLDEADNKIRFYVDQAGFNVSSFSFEFSRESTAGVINAVSANTLTDNEISVVMEKPIDSNSRLVAEEFVVQVDGIVVPVTAVRIDPENPRILILELAEELRFDKTVFVSYTGENVQSTDGSVLSIFENLPVSNNLEFIHTIPGRIQAEDFSTQSGIQLENTTDQGGGQNIGFLDIGDFADYQIEIEQAGTYSLDIRTAALSERGAIELLLIDEADATTPIGQFDFPSTGDWQNWQTSTESVELPKGRFILRLVITQPLFNINWIEFGLLTSTVNEEFVENIRLFPNPANDYMNVNATFKQNVNANLMIYDLSGKELVRQRISASEISERIDVESFVTGQYIISIQSGAEIIYTSQFFKF